MCFVLPLRTELSAYFILANFVLVLFCWGSKLKHYNLTPQSCCSKWFNSYIINPDGSEGLTPFVVYCTMTDKNGVGVTVVSHDGENKMLVYRLFSQ